VNPSLSLHPCFERIKCPADGIRGKRGGCQSKRGFSLDGSDKRFLYSASPGDSKACRRLSMRKIKKLFVWACVIGVGYFVMANHFIFVGSTPKILKKTKLSMDYTFFSTQGKTNKSILQVDELRKAGVGELLVRMGKISEGELERLTAGIEDSK
jgi:hypothetical protein